MSGVPVGLLNVLLAGLAGVTIALSMRIVGILLIAALMVLPVTAASRLARSVSSTLAVAMIVGLLSVFVGLTVSYYADLAPGGAIVLTAAGAFALAALVARVHPARLTRRMRSGRAESARMSPRRCAALLVVAVVLPGPAAAHPHTTAPSARAGPHQSPGSCRTKRYRVRRGDTLSSIARRFGTRVRAARGGERA